MSPWSLALVINVLFIFCMRYLLVRGKSAYPTIGCAESLFTNDGMLVCFIHI